MWILSESRFEQTTLKDILGVIQKNLNINYILDNTEKLPLKFKKYNMVSWVKKKVAYLLEICSEILCMK